jgi:hypothetical protein
MRNPWLAIIVVVALSACSDDENGGGSTPPDTDAAKQTDYTRESILEACVRMHSCGVERLTRVSDCMKRYEDILLMTGQAELAKTLHLCVNQAGGDCKAVLKCFGSEPTDPDCDNTYAAGCDGDVRRYCDLGDKRIYRVDCSAGGLICALDDQGRPYCAGDKCVTPGEVKCAGTRKLACLGTGMQIEQCDVIQLTCGINRDGVNDCIGPGKECEG